MKEVKIPPNTDLNTESHENNKQLFDIKTANSWLEQAKKRPIPNMLFDEFWVENDFTILFADTNSGKSILAVQIADSISKGEPIGSFRIESKKQKVLYFDFELSDKQFENRYSENYSNHFNFHENFLRLEINSNCELEKGKDFDTFLFEQIELTIIETGSKILIIDNITYLKNETEKAKDALPLVKTLKELKNKYHLSILALAHTPKRDMAKPICKNDLSGSKMLMNFIDSAFAIGESHQDKSTRYLKQIKVRHAEFKYDTDNICLVQIYKNINFLQFEFLDFGNEYDHLKQKSKDDKELLMEQAKQLSELGKSQREISKELSISVGAVNKYLKL